MNNNDTNTNKSTLKNKPSDWLTDVLSATIKGIHEYDQMIRELGKANVEQGLLSTGRAARAKRDLSLASFAVIDALEQAIPAIQHRLDNTSPEELEAALHARTLAELRHQAEVSNLGELPAELLEQLKRHVLAQHPELDSQVAEVGSIRMLDANDPLVARLMSRYPNGALPDDDPDVQALVARQPKTTVH